VLVHAVDLGDVWGLREVLGHLERRLEVALSGPVLLAVVRGQFLQSDTVEEVGEPVAEVVVVLVGGHRR
jgi:hypothetical protein